MVGKDIRLKRPQSTCKGGNIDSCEHTGVADQTCVVKTCSCATKNGISIPQKQKMEDKANTTVLRRVVQKKESLKVHATIPKGNKVRYKKMSF